MLGKKITVGGNSTNSVEVSCACTPLVDRATAADIQASNKDGKKTVGALISQFSCCNFFRKCSEKSREMS